MTVLIFVVLSALSAAVYTFLSYPMPDHLWVVIPAFIVFFLLYFLVFGVFLIITSQFAKKGTIEKINPFYLVNGTAIAQIICVFSNLRVRFTGLDKLPKDIRFLYVSNHRSGFDPVIIAAYLSRYRIGFISKPSNMNIIAAGRMCVEMGYLPIDRDNNREALKTIIQASEYLKKDICSIGIYPEGTRSKTGELGPFHAGSFKIAQKAKAPIAVVCTQGTENVKKNFPFKRTDITVEVLEVIPAEKAASSTTQELADYARNLIQNRLENTNG